MPLEDLTDLGYTVSRSPEGMLPPMATVYGFGQQWNLGTDQDEDDLVKLATNHKGLYDKLVQAETYFGDNFANWGSMTNPQKDTAMRQSQRALSNLARYVRGDLSSGGV